MCSSIFDVSQAFSTSTLTLAGTAVPSEGLALGDVEIPRPSVPTVLSMVDADGDPIPFPAWVDGSTREQCRTVERADGATGAQCYAPTRGHQIGWRDGRLPFLLPETGAATLGQEALADAAIRLEDPATGKVYIERFSDAVPVTGGFRLTVAGLDAPPIPPIPTPRDVAADPGHQEARITWIQPNDPAAILGWTVSATAPGHPSVSARLRPYEFLTGLKNDVTYTVRVVAHSEYRTDSPVSEPVQVTPTAPVPNKPVIRNVGVDHRRDTMSVVHQLNVEWKHLSYNPKCTGTVTSTDGKVAREYPLDLTSYGWTISDVPAGRTYDIGIVCTNDLGTASATPKRILFGSAPTRPGRPRVQVAPNRRATITWSAAKSDGGPVTYRVSWNGDPKKYEATSRRRLVIKKVPVGRHRVQILATNKVGTSTSPLRKIRVR